MTDVPTASSPPEYEDVIAQAIADASGGLKTVDTTATNALSMLALKQLRLQARKAELEELVKRNAEELRQVAEFDLPSAMAEVGMKSYELTDGSKINVKKVYTASIKVENKPGAFGWLREHGHDALIKTEVNVPLGKGAHEQSLEIISKLKADFDIDAQLDESVHWQTLRAFVKEQVEAEETVINNGESVDEPLPRELLGVYIIDKAEITLPKTKK